MPELVFQWDLVNLLKIIFPGAHGNPGPGSKVDENWVVPGRPVMAKYVDNPVLIA